MNAKKTVIIAELQKVAKILEKERFSRDDLYENTSVPISQRDIEGSFGSFAKAMVAADLKPAKWSKISNETLFRHYGEAYKKLGHYPLGHPGQEELSNLTPISGHTYRKRFGGLKNFLFEYKSWLVENKITRQKSVSSKATITSHIAEVQQEIESFDNKQRYTGKAAENLVVAELLFRGFNAQILQVDEGIDIFATNIIKNEIYLIQVKHTYYVKPTKSRSISVTKSSFEKNKKSNVYYIIVLGRGKDRKREFLVLPFHKVDELIENKSMTMNEESNKVTFNITHEGTDTAFIGNTDVSRYLDAWDLLL